MSDEFISVWLVWLSCSALFPYLFQQTMSGGNEKTHAGCTHAAYLLPNAVPLEASVKGMPATGPSISKKEQSRGTRMGCCAAEDASL